MPLRVTAVEQTPNPSAIKCLVDPAPTDAPRSYRARHEAEAAGDGLALRLFDAGPVSSLLIHRAFITVVKDPAAPWGTLKKAVRAAIEATA